MPVCITASYYLTLVSAENKMFVVCLLVLFLFSAFIHFILFFCK